MNKLNPQPSLVILSEARYELWPNGSSVTNAQWASAIALTLHDIRSSQKSVMIGDPEWRMSPTSCLGVHPSNVAKCALPVAKVLTPTQAGYDGVVAGGAYALGVTLLMCAATCPAISSDSFTHADQWHITEKYSAESADALGALIGCGFYDGLTNVIVKDLLAAPSAAKKAACDQYIGARGWPN